MPDPTLSESLGPDPDPVPEYNRTSGDPGRSHRLPVLPRSVPPVSYRGGIGRVQSA